MTSQQQIYTETLTTVDNLLKHINSIIHELSKLDPYSGIALCWRGHAQQCDWKLRPSVYRKDKGDPRYETSIYKVFMLEAPARYPNPPAKDDMVEWLQLMAHYGLPTRLLDWTFSPLIALFFAVSKPKHDSYPGTLWALNFHGWNHAQHPDEPVLLPDDPPIEHMAELALDFTESKYPDSGPEVLAFIPKPIDTRIILQQSFFTIHATTTPLEELTGAENFLAKLEIPQLHKGELRATLKHLGFFMRTLFPDLDHLSADIM